jgi:hypothetical protein
MGTPSVSSSNGVAGMGAQNLILSPDAILAYCTTRLSDLDSIINAKITEQNNQNDLAKQWSQLEATLTQWPAVPAGEAAQADSAAVMARQLADQYSKTTDPALLAKIAGFYKEVTGVDIQDAINSPAGGGGSVDALLKSTTYFDPSAGGGGGSATPPCLNKAAIQGVGADDWKSQIESVKDQASKVTQGSDLDMIAIQSLVSQRQQGVQLCTQMLQSIDESVRGILANTGGR